jgi:hypothetical protein
VESIECTYSYDCCGKFKLGRRGTLAVPDYTMCIVPLFGAPHIALSSGMVLLEAQTSIQRLPCTISQLVLAINTIRKNILLYNFDQMLRSRETEGRELNTLGIGDSDSQILGPQTGLKISAGVRHSPDHCLW